MNFFKIKQLPFWFYPVKLIFALYVLGILVFTLLRLLFFVIYFNQISQISEHAFWEILAAFFMGWRFDTVVSMYLLAVPTVFLFFTFPFHKLRNFILTFVIYFVGIVYPITFLVSFADIPYFGQFGCRFNTMAFAWIDNPRFVIGMIFGEIRYWIYILPLTMLIFGWVRIIKLIIRINRQKMSVFQTQKFSFFVSSIYFFTMLVAFSIMFLGMRGRVEKKSPIRIGTAFISNYNFINQLGLNPSFTLLRSWLDDLQAENKPLSLMDDKEALLFMKRELGISNSISNESPIARKILDTAISPRPNVVMVIMEAMSASKMKKYGNPEDLTPNLEKLAPHALFFNNIYSAGIHTYNGIYSSLYSFPSLLKKHTMNEFPTPIYTGLPGILKQNGYTNTFILTHDDQFDNMAGFLKANHYDKIVSQKNYPFKEVLSTLGVPDHYMFKYAIENTINENVKEPFFATFMTGSDHGPHIIPKNIAFKSNHSDILVSIIEYADWSIGYFLDLARKQPWFENTIFVFVADHGYSGTSPYEVSMDYHHIPFIIYSPKYIPHGREYNQVGLQVDVAQTVLGFLKLSYINSTQGINLLENNRKYAVFSSDDKIGCLNDSLLSIIHPDGSQKMYFYKQKSMEDVCAKYKDIADDMKKYAYAYIQSTQWLIQNHYSSSGLNKKGF